MSYGNLPEDVTGTESFFAVVESQVILATCIQCGHDGDVDASRFLLAFGPTETVYEFEWKCPNPSCGAENEETRTYRNGEDDA